MTRDLIGQLQGSATEKAHAQGRLLDCLLLLAGCRIDALFQQHPEFQGRYSAAALIRRNRSQLQAQLAQKIDRLATSARDDGELFALAWRLMLDGLRGLLRRAIPSWDRKVKGALEVQLRHYAACVLGPGAGAAVKAAVDASFDKLSPLDLLADTDLHGKLRDFVLDECCAHLVLKYQGALRWAVAHYVGREDVDDVLQELLSGWMQRWVRKVLARLPADWRGVPKCYVRRWAVKRAHNWQRGKRRAEARDRKSAVRESAAARDRVRESECVQIGDAWWERQSDRRKKVLRLPPTMTSAEVAERLGVSEATVKRDRQGARQELERDLGATPSRRARRRRDGAPAAPD